MTVRSPTDVVNTASPSPSSHTRTVSTSPGMTGAANRTSTCSKRAGSQPAHRVQERPAGEPERAETVQDRAVESAHGGERRVGVQRVAVAREAVDQAPGRVTLGRHLVVGCPVGRHVLRAGRPALAAPATLAADEHRGAVGVERLAVGTARVSVTTTAALPLSYMATSSVVTVAVPSGGAVERASRPAGRARASPGCTSPSSTAPSRDPTRARPGTSAAPAGAPRRCSRW